MFLLLATHASAQLASASSATGRSLEDIERLRQNASRLSIKLQLDRTEYFPGEDAELKITIRNPGPNSLEVLEPFYAATGSVIAEMHSVAKDSSSGWGRLLQEEYSDWNPYAHAPSHWLQPGASEERTFRFSDDAVHVAVEPGGTRRVASICGRDCNIPTDEGEYRFCYTYASPGAACVDFRVVSPELVSITPVRLEKPREIQPRLPNGMAMGPVRKVPRVVHVLLLRHAEQYILAVSIRTGDGREIRPDANGKLTGDVSREFGPYQRLDVSSVPIRSIEAIADSGDNMTIHYVKREGQSTALRLDARRKVIQ